MTLEHYPGMTEKALAAIVDEAKSRWDIVDALVIHRVGALEARRPDRARRRHERASRRRVRRVRIHHGLSKTRAPFWKKEETPAGARWVEARASDDDAAARWQRAGSRGLSVSLAVARTFRHATASLDPARRVGYRRGP